MEVKILLPQAAEKLGFWSRFLRQYLPKLDLTIRTKKALRELGQCDLLLDFTSVLLKQAHFFRAYKKVYWIHGPKTHMGPAELKEIFDSLAQL